MPSSADRAASGKRVAAGRAVHPRERGQVGRVGGAGDGVGGDAPNGGILMAKERRAAASSAASGPSTSPAHAWSPAPTTRAVAIGEERRAASRPGDRGALGGRRPLPPILALAPAAAAACANAAVSTRARATQRRPAEREASLPAGRRGQARGRLGTAQLPRVSAVATCTLAQRIVEQRRRACRRGVESW